MFSMTKLGHGRLSRRKFLMEAAAASAGLTMSLGSSNIGAQAAQGATARNSSRDRLEQALARIADRNGEGVRTVLTVYANAARAAADASDARARAGNTLGPLDGAIVTIKDLFDVAGEPTRAGVENPRPRGARQHGCHGGASSARGRCGDCPARPT
jgi:hypothetical protein